MQQKSKQFELWLKLKYLYAQKNSILRRTSASDEADREDSIPVMCVCVDVCISINWCFRGKNSTNCLPSSNFNGYSILLISPSNAYQIHIATHFPSLKKKIPTRLNLEIISIFLRRLEKLSWRRYCVCTKNMKMPCVKHWLKIYTKVAKNPL